jgi:predicted dehydrogenase
VYTDAARLIADEAVEGVILATPATAHLDGARLASGAGLPALVEKPPAASADEVVGMSLLDRPPAIGFNRRFEPGMKRLRAAIPPTGELEVAISLRHRAGSWDSYDVSDDALLTLGPHLLDLARWLTRSEIEEVRALELQAGLATLELSLDRGRARISCATDSAPIDLVEVRRNDRTCATYSAGGRLRRGLRRLRHPLGAGALVRSLALQLEAFAAAVRGDRAEGLGTVDDGVAVMRVIEAARRSHASGGERRSVAEPTSVH